MSDTYRLTSKDAQRVLKRRRKKPISFHAKVHPTPQGAKQYDVPTGCNAVRLVKTGAPDKVLVEFLYPAESSADDTPT
jgi:hypothetical protein